MFLAILAFLVMILVDDLAGVGSNLNTSEEPMFFKDLKLA